MGVMKQAYWTGWRIVSCTVRLSCHETKLARHAHSAAKTRVSAIPRDPSPRKSVVPVFKKAPEFGDRVAIRDMHGEYTYRGILTAANKLADIITSKLQGKCQERVAFLCPNDASYVIVQWACWISGQIAVPLSQRHPESMLEYFVTDCDSNLMITVPQSVGAMKNVAVKVGCKLHVFDDADRKEAMRKEEVRKEEIDTLGFEPTEIGKDTSFYDYSDALIVYTSGTTGTPKGVVLSHLNLHSQMNALVGAWEWQQRDCILHVLPLHHIHGIVNALLCPLSVGARCVMMEKFDSAEVWAELMGVQKSAVDRVNILMGVPTMYARLIEQYESSLRKTDRMMDYIRSTCSQKIRLMVSGSAPLPKSIFEKWEQITGHQLLERYGMTETGMVLSNPLHGSRVQGSVGLPLPGVYVRISSDNDNAIIAEGSNTGTRVINICSPTIGQLQVRGDSVFRQYWRKPNATSREFTKDGWFKTGDIVQYNKGLYMMLGRKSTDIIKSGGFKVSAVQVESVLLDHNSINDIAVIGIQDETWGQKIVAVLTLKNGQELNCEELKKWAKDRLPDYAVPSVFRIVDSLPRNAMGKLNKEDLINDLVEPKL